MRNGPSFEKAQVLSFTLLSSFSTYLRVFHSCTVLTLYFFHVSFDRGQRTVAAGLFISQGRQTKASFDFCCLFLLLPKSNVIALLSSQYRRGGGNSSTGEGRQVVIPEQDDGRDFGKR